MSCNPWTRWFFRDWLCELTLRKCSAGARGFWMDMLCIAANSPRYGYVEIHGVPCTPGDLARQTGEHPRSIHRWVRELEAAGVFSRDENGVIFCRRMVREAARCAPQTPFNGKIDSIVERGCFEQNQRANPDDSRARAHHLLHSSTEGSQRRTSGEECSPARARGPAWGPPALTPEPEPPAEEVPPEPTPPPDIDPKAPADLSNLAANVFGRPKPPPLPPPAREMLHLAYLASCRLFDEGVNYTTAWVHGKPEAFAPIFKDVEERMLAAKWQPPETMGVSL
jgi:hypothetical protein